MRSPTQSSASLALRASIIRGLKNRVQRAVGGESRGEIGNAEENEREGEREGEKEEPRDERNLRTQSNGTCLLRTDRGRAKGYTWM